MTDDTRLGQVAIVLVTLSHISKGLTITTTSDCHDTQFPGTVPVSPHKERVLLSLTPLFVSLSGDHFPTIHT